MKERIGWIDIAKGICMISVILGHMGVPELGFVYSYHLTTFFILSGYTLRKVPITNGYLKNKFRQLMVPYFVTCAAVTVMEVINAVCIRKNFSISVITKLLYTDILRSFFASGTHKSLGTIEIGPCIGAIWFLPAQFFALVFTLLIIHAFHSKKAQAASALAIALVGCVSSQVIWLPFSVQAAMLAVPFLLLGMCLKEYQALDKFQYWHYIIFAAVYVLGCFGKYAQVFYMVTCTMKDWLFTPLCAVCSSMLVIGLSRKIRRLPALEFIGRNSLVFLCVHLFELNTLSWYYSRVCQVLSMPDNKFSRLILRLLVVCLVSYIMTYLMGRRTKKIAVPVQNGRDVAFDILRSLLIVLMLVGHAAIDPGLKRLIYSVHMMAFVMVSGYFYKSGMPLKTNARKALKTLVPYCVFAVLYVGMKHHGWTVEIKDLLIGVSFTKNYFAWASSVGPVYFILMLFIVKILYVCLESCKNEWVKNGVILGLCSLGVFLGNKGVWLPWSLDCALFALLFYHAAYCMRRWGILQSCKESPYIYFLLSCVWAIMVHKGSMELAVRQYGNVGMTILGGCSAFVLLYLLCDGISAALPEVGCRLIGLVGQSTAHILVVHTLFHGKVTVFARDVLQLNPENIFHLGVSIGIEIAIGVAAFLMIKAVGRSWKLGMQRGMLARECR